MYPTAPSETASKLFLGSALVQITIQQELDIIAPWRSWLFYLVLTAGSISFHIGTPPPPKESSVL